MKKSVLTLILFLFLVSLSACTSPTKKEQDIETRTITHAAGETDIPVSPERVVILTNEGTEALLALGVQPIGAVKSWNGDPWYTHITDDMVGVTMVGLETDVNLEAIAALEPDLIIGNKLRQEDVYESLSLIAPTVFSETLRGNWQENFNFYANVMNLETEGERLLAEYTTKVEEVKTYAETNNLLDTEIAVLRFMAASTRLYLTDSFSGVILEQIGFKRTLIEDPNGGNFATEIKKEQLLDVGQSSDLIVYFTYETGNQDATTTQNNWINDQIFKNLPATKAGHVYNVNDSIWNTSGGILAANMTLDKLQTILTDYISE